MTAQVARLQSRLADGVDGLPPLLIDANSSFRYRRIGEILVSTGMLLPANLDQALSIQSTDATRPLGTILVDQKLISESALATGLALQRGALRVIPTAGTVDPAMIDLLGADRCLRHGVMPWRQRNGYTIIATARPHRFEALRPMLERALGPVRVAIASAHDIEHTIVGVASRTLVERAESRPLQRDSVRAWRPPQIAAVMLAVAAVLIGGLLAAPHQVATALAGWAALMLALTAGLRLAALRALQRQGRVQPPEAGTADLPAVSILVPLLNKAAISGDLMDRLAALDYPDDLLDILLITEANDAETRAAVMVRKMSGRVRVIRVPPGSVRTKPRALNYALDFSFGDIVGVLDAEDAPDPDQLRVVAAHFQRAAPDLACLQGQLDFCNARQSWLARCLALDYAAWFRVIQPGLCALRLPIPLGGTTVYLRRDALEAVGRWDAHNVTEDADLGLRLARHGWRTEFAATATREEANCRVGPWIRQRARRLTGYALTYAVHMRRPAELWRELGPLGFLTMQIMFLGTVSLSLLAPLLWSFWSIPLGLGHPLAAKMPPCVLWTVAGVLVMSGAVNLGIAAYAVWREDRWLLKWIPTTLVYSPLAALACYRAMSDIAIRPFLRDKTAHAHSISAISQMHQNSQHSDADGFQRHD